MLYSLPIWVGLEHRNVYLYAIGTVIYAFIHWFLFSSMSNGCVTLQKYKYGLYAIVLADLAYIVHQNKKQIMPSYPQMPMRVVMPVQNAHQQPLIEQLPVHAHAPPTIAVDNNSSISLPVYIPEYAGSSAENPDEPKEDTSVVNAEVPEPSK